MENWLEIGCVDDFKDKDRKTVKNAVVFYSDDKFYACENRCPHMGYPMNKGTVRDGVVSCAWHNWQFDMKSGGCYRGACDDLQTYDVKVEDGKVFINLQDSYEHFAMHAARLVEGMRAMDEFLQAKAISLMQKCDGTSEDVVMVAVEQAYRHSQINHRNFQAIYEFQAIADSLSLSEGLTNREKIGVLLQGIRTAGGSSGDRMSVVPLPEDHITESKLKKLLLRYTEDSSALGLERLLMNTLEQGAFRDIEPWLLEIATESFFVDIRQAFICLSAIIHYGEVLDISRFKPALYAWTMGNRRVEADLETKDAMKWLESNSIDFDKFTSNEKSITVDRVQEIVSGNDIEQNFRGTLQLLEDGVSFECLLNAFSTISARRFSRIPINNGGLWNTATEGIRYCHAVRRMSEIYKGPYQYKALFHMVFYFFKSRWIKFSGEWNGSNSEGTWSEFAEAFAESNVKVASNLALGLVEADKEWRHSFLKPLLQEDNNTMQLNTLVACLGELEASSEWQHYVSGLVTYGIDMKMGQTVLSAAKFGRSYLR